MRNRGFQPRRGEVIKKLQDDIKAAASEKRKTTARKKYERQREK